MTGFIHSTESFGTVDGPGVRFVVFFQGCPMRCLYCHNPDTWELHRGREVTPEALLQQYDRNKAFYRSGGITATGGEPMLQPGFLAELFGKAQAQGVHTCLDTSGICYDPAHPEAADAVLDVTNLVMLDIKHIDAQRHKALTGHSNRNILAFAEHISDRGIPLWIRHVIVPGWTDDAAEQIALGEFLGGLKTLKALDCLPYHDLGKVKYERLGIPYPLPDAAPVSPEAAAKARDTILKGIRKRLKQDKQTKKDL